MKSLGFSHTPQDTMEKYNGFSVPMYIRYSSLSSAYKASLYPQFESDLGTEIGFLTFHPGIETPANRLQEGFNKGIR